MSDILTSLADAPYLAWAFGVAAGIYWATRFAVSHLHPDKKAHLSLWLQGDYESTWSTQFCAMFDSIFGEKHWRPRCILLSAVASVIAVFVLWLLFDQILGLISLRADTGLSLTQALLLGAAINIIPDYISLYETRWLLKRFEQVRNPLGQLAVLAVDAVVTGTIIFSGVALYLAIVDERPVSLIEMVALFSFYAIFFYSTFVTSLWAWAYCLSSWISRLSARLRHWLDVQNAPGASLALIGAAFVLLAAVALKPALTMDENGRMPADQFLCDTFPAAACTHVARLTKDEKQQLALLSKACIGGVTEECLAAGFQRYELEPEQAARLWEKACEGGITLGCSNLGFLYSSAFGVSQDYSRAKKLYEKGCAGGIALGCAYLGVLYSNGQGVDQDYDRARNLYEEACARGSALGCTNLGKLYGNGHGVDQDYDRARKLFEEGCGAGSAQGCTNLGFLYGNGLGVDHDFARARSLYERGCEGGDADGCDNLGRLFPRSLGGDQNADRARNHYEKACADGEAIACSNLGVLYAKGRDVPQDVPRARALYGKACAMGFEHACELLAKLPD